MAMWHRIKHDNDQWFIDLDQFAAFVLMVGSEPDGNGGTDGRDVYFVRCHYRLPHNEKSLDLALSQPACKLRKNAEAILDGIMMRVDPSLIPLLAAQTKKP